MSRVGQPEDPIADRMPRRRFVKTALGAVSASVAFPPFVSSGERVTLRDAAESRKILAGSAVSNAQLHNPQLRGILAQQCGILVAQNEMKWRATRPEPGHYDFTKADELMDFAAKHSIPLRGHNLCWHESNPKWLKEVATEANAGKLLQDHIQTVVGRYAGRIHSWDVVNEALDPGGCRSDGMRDSLWMQLLGPQYIAMAYRAAAEADPKALLTYNDYGLEEGGGYNDRRRNVTLAFLRWMRENHIPLHALGLQSHFTAHYDQLPDWGGLHSFLKEVQKLDLQVFVTELDINDTDLSTKPEKRNKQVAEFCGDYLKNVLKHAHVTAVLTWGMVSYSLRPKAGDDASEVRHIALPLDEKLEPTPFLSAMIRSFQKH